MGYELTHDTIARQVYDKASTEARTRRKIEKFIRERHQAYLERGARLTQDDVDYVTPYLGQVNISDEEAAFVEYARRALQRARRRIRMLVTGVIVVLAALLGVAVWQWIEAQEQSKIAQEKTRKAIRSEEETKEALILADSALEAQNRAISAEALANSIAKQERDEAIKQTKIANDERDRAEKALRKADSLNRVNEYSYRALYEMLDNAIAISEGKESLPLAFYFDRAKPESSETYSESLVEYEKSYMEYYNNNTTNNPLDEFNHKTVKYEIFFAAETSLKVLGEMARIFAGHGIPIDIHYRGSGEGYSFNSYDRELVERRIKCIEQELEKNLGEVLNDGRIKFIQEPWESEDKRSSNELLSNHKYSLESMAARRVILWLVKRK